MNLRSEIGKLLSAEIRNTPPEALDSRMREIAEDLRLLQAELRTVGPGSQPTAYEAETWKLEGDEPPRDMVIVTGGGVLVRALNNHAARVLVESHNRALGRAATEGAAAAYGRAAGDLRKAAGDYVDTATKAVPARVSANQIVKRCMEAVDDAYHPDLPAVSAGSVVRTAKKNIEKLLGEFELSADEVGETGPILHFTRDLASRACEDVRVGNAACADQPNPLDLGNQCASCNARHALRQAKRGDVVVAVLECGCEPEVTHRATCSMRHRNVAGYAFMEGFMERAIKILEPLVKGAEATGTPPRPSGGVEKGTEFGPSKWATAELRKALSIGSRAGDPKLAARVAQRLEEARASLRGWTGSLPAHLHEPLNEAAAQFKMLFPDPLPEPDIAILPCFEHGWKCGFHRYALGLTCASGSMRIPVIEAALSAVDAVGRRRGVSWVEPLDTDALLAAVERADKAGTVLEEFLIDCWGKKLDGRLPMKELSDILEPLRAVLRSVQKVLPLPERLPWGEDRG